MKGLGPALGWNAATAAAQGLGTFGRLGLIAWMAGPGAAGHYAMAMSLTMAATAATELGLRQQYVSSAARSGEGDGDELLSEVWRASILLRSAIFIFSLVAAIVGWAQGVDLASVLAMAAIIALGNVVAAAASPELLRAEARARFDVTARVEIVGHTLAFAGLLVTCLSMNALAKHAGSWLLAAAHVLYGLTVCGFSRIVYPNANLPRPAFGYLRRLISRGRHYQAIAVATFITYGVDKLVVGVLAGPAQAGVYLLAQRLSEPPLAVAAPVLSRTMLPLLSRVGVADASLIQSHIRRVLTWFGLVAISLGIGYGLAAMFIPRSSSEWSELRAATLILLASACARAACQIIAPALIAQGKVHLDARYKLQEATLHVPAILLSTWLWGVMGAAWCTLIIYVTSLLRRLHLLRSEVRAA